MSPRIWTPREDDPAGYTKPEPTPKPTRYAKVQPDRPVHRISYDQDFEEVTKKFRFAHVLKPGFDFKPLVPYCERIVYSTDGYGDTVLNLREQLEESMQRFDPDKDVLIPVGSATICTLAATMLVQIMLSSGSKNWSSYAMGVYTEGEYQFWRVPLSPDEEAYDILLR